MQRARIGTKLEAIVAKLGVVRAATAALPQTYASPVHTTEAWKTGAPWGTMPILGRLPGCLEWCRLMLTPVAAHVL